MEAAGGREKDNRRDESVITSAADPVRTMKKKKPVVNNKRARVSKTRI
jgi:hypothetical protein